MRRFGGRRLFSTYGAHHRRVAADLEQHSSNDPASLAQRALLLSTDYRLHEASEVLQQLGDTESDAMIRDEIRKIEAQMADALSAGASFAPPRTIHFPVPESVFVSESSGLGLFAARDFDVGEVVFVESPIGVASDTGDACSNCLKPLGARHVLRSDGSVAKEFRSEHVETLFAGCGLEKLEPMEGCCSKKCCEAMRLKGVVKKKKSRKNLDSTTLLLQNLSPSERQAVTRNLLMCADGAAEIPENLSLDEASAWSAVRKNAIEVVTSSLAVMAGPSGFEPVVDPNKEPSTGSALYLVASLVNHRCLGANLAPSFVDSLIDTQFVATRAIKRNSELFFDYSTSVTNLFDKRIRNFLAHGFVCDMKSCNCRD